MVRIGNIDGKGKIYDDRGELILNNGEQILYKNDEKRCVDVWKGWKPSSGNNLLFNSTAEIGTTYITNQRMIHIRTPDPYRKAKDELTPLGVPSAIPKMMKAKELLKRGGKEYCEIYFSEIKWYSMQKKKKYLSFYTITPSNSEIQYIVRKDKRDDKKMEIIENLLPNSCIKVRNYKEIYSKYLQK